jgi:Glycosyltransferase family 10 (fucosyltransferase) C-term/Fucosyltransferase, N-terminal
MLKDCILFYYNHHFFCDPTWSPIPANCKCQVIDDKSELFKVKCVVFHLPSLLPQECLELPEIYQHKPPDQVWAIHCLESAANYPLLDDLAFMQLFDYEISYRQTAQIFSHYFDRECLQIIRTAQVQPQEKFCAAFISSGWNLSKRKQLLYKLMSYLSIDSYGSFMKNQVLPEDTGDPYSPERAAIKRKVIANYRFTLAFENSICADYVTEKFFEPLMVGSIPVYWGAPNIDEFSPGDNAYINAANFNSIKELAEFLETVDATTYHQWRKQPIRPSFLEKVEKSNGEPLDRLWSLICQTNDD